jgi:sigma-B regulation protein RsbU (phosphoserine phosphatase)
VISSYATLILGRLDPGGAVELVNAGHCPPIVLRGRAAERVPATGVPLGLMGDATFDTQRLELAPGDLLFAYTDGLSEAPNGDGEQLGADRIARALLAHAGADLDTLLDSCVEAATSFGAGAPRTDDLTLIAIRRTGP